MATRIRVADAPLLGRKDPAPELSFDRGVPEAPASTSEKMRRIYFYCILALLLGCFLGLFGPRHGEAVRPLIVARYLLWPLSLIGLSMHVSRYGTRQLTGTIALLMPFGLIGAFSGLIGYDIIGSAKQVIFWAFGVTVAAAVGFELPNMSIRRFLLGFFLMIGLVSIALAILVPSYATTTDVRLAQGAAWVGVFSGKNELGEAASYLVVLAFVVRMPGWLRCVPLAIGAVCLYTAHSQGSVVTTAIVLGLMASIVALRRMGLTPGLQAAILITATLVAGAGFMFGLGPLLGALGRDPTLTGRTIIWGVYFQRALYFWLFGAGPGTFTDTSRVTSDLLLVLQSIGTIRSPHNMYIAAFGETGFAGLLALVIPLFYMGLVIPFTRAKNPVSLPVAAVSLLMIIGGLVETHEVFGPSPRMALIVMLMATLRATDLKSEGREGSDDGWRPDPAGADPALPADQNRRLSALR